MRGPLCEKTQEISPALTRFAVFGVTFRSSCKKQLPFCTTQQNCGPIRENHFPSLVTFAAFFVQNRSAEVQKPWSFPPLTQRTHRALDPAPRLVYTREVGTIRPHSIVTPRLPAPVAGGYFRQKEKRHV